MSKAWDNNILKKLKALVGKGLSTSEIGKKLGISKNAVVGKLHRLGWNAKAADSDVLEQKVVKKAEPKKAKIAVKPVKKVEKVDKKTKTVKPVKKPVTVSKVAKVKVTPKKEEKTVANPAPKKTGGHAIAGNKGISVHQRMVQHFHFCGHTVFVGKPYCYEHCKQAYQFTPPKKK